MTNSDKIILDLCGGSGSWSRPYKEAGYRVFNITLPGFDILATDFSSDKIVFHNADRSDYLAIHDLSCVYGILCAPPCTEFSQAKNVWAGTAAGKRDIPGALEIVDACLRIVRHCQLYGNLRWWAMENPAGKSSSEPLAKYLGKPAYSFEQWQFGGTECKLTYLWGWFKEPKPIVAEKPDGVGGQMGGRTGEGSWAKPTVPAWALDYINRFKGDERRAAIRAIYPEGFAKAFFKANK